MEILFIVIMAFFALPVALLGYVIYCLVKWLRSPKQSAERAKRATRSVVSSVIFICYIGFVATVLFFFTAAIANM